jgi:type IV pilus assembly protein PilE
MIRYSARPHLRLSGFTLTEILVVLVIAGLLAAFGLPAFLKYSSRGRITTAQSLLKKIAGEESEWLASHKTYATLNQLGYPLDSSRAAVYLDKDGSVAGSASDDSIYRVSIKLQPPSVDAHDHGYFLITAQPVNGQVKDSNCATLGLDSTGQVSDSGTRSEDQCWEKSD